MSWLQNENDIRYLTHIIKSTHWRYIYIYIYFDNPVAREPRMGLARYRDIYLVYWIQKVRIERLVYWDNKPVLLCRLLVWWFIGTMRFEHELRCSNSRSRKEPGTGLLPEHVWTIGFYVSKIVPASELTVIFERVVLSGLILQMAL